MSEQVYDAMAMQLVARSLTSSVTRIQAEVAVTVVAIIATLNGSRLVYPEGMSEHEAQAVLRSAVSNLDELAYPDANNIVLEPLPPAVAELVALHAAREQIVVLDQAYCYALRVMRRCEQILIEHGVDQNWVGSAHSRADDWERNRTRHLSAIIEHALHPSEPSDAR